jgi:hypothetical protein
MTTVRAIIAVLMLAGIATASADYQPVDTTNFATRAAAYEGQLVAVTGKVCAVNADGKGVRLFDAETKALIEINLSQLGRSQRRTLMLSGVHQISVYGKAEMKNGKLIIDAHRVVVRDETVPTVG